MHVELWWILPELLDFRKWALIGFTFSIAFNEFLDHPQLEVKYKHREWLKICLQLILHTIFMHGDVYHEPHYNIVKNKPYYT